MDAEKQTAAQAKDTANTEAASHVRALYKMLGVCVRELARYCPPDEIMAQVRQHLPTDPPRPPRP